MWIARGAANDMSGERVKHGRLQAVAVGSCQEPKCSVCSWQRQSAPCIDPQAGTASSGAAEHHCDPKKSAGLCEETRRGGAAVAARNLDSERNLLIIHPNHRWHESNGVTQDTLPARAITASGFQICGSELQVVASGDAVD